MDKKQGSISINTENIFPIIKKWLYSEKDIFIREIVSNASDAINKLKKLESLGEAEVPDCEWRIDVALDEENRTISVTDNGIGMTADEVEKYINQIAFSGAKDFIEKYNGKTDDAQIIGHFGLGFYSAFMVSDKVEIDSLSYVAGSEAVHWESESGMDFSIAPSEKTGRGTTVTLHIAEDSSEYLDRFKLEDTLRKYFSFLNVKMYFSYPEEKKEDKEDSSSEKNEEDGSAEDQEIIDEKPQETGLKTVVINEKEPLWLKNPSDCTEEEYKEFYYKVFRDYNDPLFWIHLNVDYPFNLKGILYFPKIEKENFIEGQIKIYYNQVFVADNIKEILPDFLMLLKGTIDCPDLPLNVSRSFLQNDGYVNKISAHITKKVADKLNGMFKTDRENYNKYWDDISPFIKFGCIRDEKFYEKVKDSLIYKLTNDEYVSAEEYGKKYSPEGADKTVIYYTDNPVWQSQYISMLKEAGIDAAVMDFNMIDVNFMSFIEYKSEGKIKFDRVDANISDKVKGETSNDISESIKNVLEGAFRKVANNDKLTVTSEPIKSEMPAFILLSEQGRRMQEFAKMYGDKFAGMGLGGDDVKLVLNSTNPAVLKLSSLPADDTATDEEKQERELICEQIYGLAMLAHRPMEKDELTKFLENSAKLLNRL